MKIRKLMGAVLSAVIAAGIIAALPAEYSDGFDIAFTASAAKNGFIVKTDKDGDQYISGYNGKGGDITIPDGIVWIGAKAFYGNKDITSVTIPASCWYWVDKQAFAFCPNLKSVTFKGDIGGIGEEAFYGCTALEKITFGGDVGRQSLDGGIGSYAFSYCSSLTTVDFTDSTAQVDMLGGCAFSDCIRLKKVSLPSDLKYIYSDVFVNCSALTDINIPAKAKFKGTHALGYMYGGTSSGAKNDYVKADGSTKVYVSYWKDDGGNISEAGGYIAQKSITITAAKGSDAAKYAESNGISCNYTDEVYEDEPEKLAAPKNIKAAESAGKIVLTWDSVEGADRYRVYMYNAETGKYEEYKTVKNCKCTVSGVESGAEYKFVISALDSVNGKYVRGKTSKAVSVTGK